mmetsp:Transcript_13026/g.32478  ORF Transcript_13026/g.32478 Transcript_13026/m.32478 type:complete len:452 (+) Transcript_13026:107-1462(+)
MTVMTMKISSAMAPPPRRRVLFYYNTLVVAFNILLIMGTHLTLANVVVVSEAADNMTQQHPNIWTTTTTEDISDFSDDADLSMEQFFASIESINQPTNALTLDDTVAPTPQDELFAEESSILLSTDVEMNATTTAPQPEEDNLTFLQRIALRRQERRRAYEEYLEMRTERRQQRRARIRAALTGQTLDENTSDTSDARTSSSAEDEQIVFSKSTANNTAGNNTSDESTLLERMAQLLSTETGETVSTGNDEEIEGVAGAFQNASSILMSAFQSASQQVGEAIEDSVNTTQHSIATNLENTTQTLRTNLRTGALEGLAQLEQQLGNGTGMLAEARAALEAQFGVSESDITVSAPSVSGFSGPSETSAVGEESAKSGGLSGGAIAGIMIVVIVAVVGIFGGGVVVYRRRSSAASSGDERIREMKNAAMQQPHHASSSSTHQVRGRMGTVKLEV